MTFILICTFVVLNLFIAVVVRAMEDDHTAHSEGRPESDREAEQDANSAVLAELAALRTDVQVLCARYDPGMPCRVGEVNDLGP